MNKICSKCKKEKTIDKFYKNVSRKEKLSDWCKLCILKQQKIYYSNHKEELKQNYKKHYQLNKEKIKLKQKQYYQIYKEKVKQYYQIHKEQVKQYQKLHRKEINEYQNNKRKTDINYKLGLSLRHRLNLTLKGNFKSETTMKLLGCSIEFFKEHLEKQFKQGMTWANYGKWHIDHIKPCASFDLSQAEEQARCFNYINLRPLWAEENLRRKRK